MDQSRVWKTIGDVARATGTKVQTVRYYEELGLLPPAPRSSGNQRLYDDAAQKRLSFIRHATWAFRSRRSETCCAWRIIRSSPARKPMPLLRANWRRSTTASIA